MVHGSVDIINHGHIYVSMVIQLHMLFLCKESQNTLVLELHLFQTFVGICDGEASGIIYMLRS